MSLDDAAEAALRERWSRSQRHITAFSVVLPALRHWLRHQAPLDPLKWLPAAFLVVGVQLLSRPACPLTEPAGHYSHPWWPSWDRQTCACQVLWLQGSLES